jgi:magnesium-transporting ATPase (P-type)
LGAISVTCSARFTYNSSLHPRLFKGNVTLIYSIVIVILLQILLTYTPFLSNVVFSMEGMDGMQRGITILFVAVVFLVMEAEKWLRRYLRARGKDTDDIEESMFDREVEPLPPGTRLLPKGGSKFSIFK